MNDNIKITRYYILLTLVFFTFQQIFSQQFKGGVLLGFTAAQVDGDGYAGYKQPGLTGGFYTNTKISKNMLGQIEIKYTAKGARETGDENDPMLYQMKLRYMEVPVKFIYNIEKFKCSVEAGISQGYLFHQHAEGTDDNQNIVDLLDQDPLRKYELGWLLGGSYHFTDKFKLSVIFNYSFLPVRKYENSDYNYGILARNLWMNRGDYNNNFQFALYYMIDK